MLNSQLLNYTTPTTSCQCHRAPLPNSRGEGGEGGALQQMALAPCLVLLIPPQAPTMPCHAPCINITSLSRPVPNLEASFAPCIYPCFPGCSQQVSQPLLSTMQTIIKVTTLTPPQRNGWNHARMLHGPKGCAVVSLSKRREVCPHKPLYCLPQAQRAPQSGRKLPSCSRPIQCPSGDHLDQSMQLQLKAAWTHNTGASHKNEQGYRLTEHRHMSWHTKD